MTPEEKQKIIEWHNNNINYPALYRDQFPHFISALPEEMSIGMIVDMDTSEGIAKLTELSDIEIAKPEESEMVCVECWDIINSGKHLDEISNDVKNQIAIHKIEEYRYSSRDMPLNVDNVLDDCIDWLKEECNIG